MESLYSSCVIVADRNVAASESIRGLLESEFQSVYLVADTGSLTTGAERLAPDLVVLDLSFGAENLSSLVDQIHQRSPHSHVLVLTINDEAIVARSTLEAGADAVVLKRCAGTDLYEALAALGRGERYSSPQFEHVLG